MKNIILVFSITLLSSIGNASSIDLTFNDPYSFGSIDYRVPNRSETPTQNLISLSSEAVESICFHGNPANVIAMLDRVVSRAGEAVREYRRTTRHGRIFVQLKVLNAIRKVQAAELEISSCR